MNLSGKYFQSKLRIPALLLSSILLLSTSIKEVHATPTHSSANFQKWLTGFKKQARQAGISEKTLESAFKNVTVDDSVLRSDRKQPEFSRTFFQYLERAVSPTRIHMGQQNFKQYRKLLNQVEQTYAIPAEILTAFWGMETNYGSFTGSLPIIQSLATLAYDPRRSQFFRKELMAALKILDQGHVKLEEMKGSWAGAMGQVQFMPSNYLKYSVDGDGDGKINLWKSLPDAFYSAGNFLKALGWDKSQPWGYEVTLPQKFNYALADGKTARSVDQWGKVGVKKANGKPLKDSQKKAYLVLPSDYRGPAFLVFDNFKVIKRWNNSTNYAIAVGYLSQRITDGPALSKSRPKDDRALSRKQLKELQQLLNRLGHKAGKPDGVAGSMTRSALRQFQKRQKLPADGYPSLKVLQQLRKASKTLAKNP